MSPNLLLTFVAARCREIRLATNEPQADLAARAGISHATLKRFESTGIISSLGLVSILTALKRENGLIEELKKPTQPAPSSLDAIISSQPQVRKRARKIRVTRNASNSSSSPLW